MIDIRIVLILYLSGNLGISSYKKALFLTKKINKLFVVDA